MGVISRWHLESMSPCPITPWVLRIYIVNFMTRPTGVDDSAIGGQGNAIARDVCADSSPMPRPRATAASARQGGGHRSALSTSTVLYMPSARQAPRPRRNNLEARLRFPPGFQARLVGRLHWCSRPRGGRHDWSRRAASASAVAGRTFELTLTYSYICIYIRASGY